MINIFLAEDDPLMIRIYEKTFRIAGFHLDIALDGDEAIQKLTIIDPKPAVIILDIMMPKKTGFDVLEFTKKNNDLKDIPVILLTNLFGEQDEKKGFELGAVAYLVKSQSSPMEIAEKVKNIYEKYHVKE
ncbi:MAG: response regulator [Candidatus Paceibacterota bacterium]|jgi:CheY-like chemotaxis protein